MILSHQPAPLAIPNLFSVHAFACSHRKGCLGTPATLRLMIEDGCSDLRPEPTLLGPSPRFSAPLKVPVSAASRAFELGSRDIYQTFWAFGPFLKA